MSISVPVSWGELIDKITILEIKSERISNTDKLKNVHKELELLKKERDHHVPEGASLTTLYKNLKAINETLWDIEDRIRICEQKKEFGDVFIELARSVYQVNDQRAAVKKQVNEALGSDLYEEKEYVSYA